MKLLLGEALWSPGTGAILPAGGAAVALDEAGRALAWGEAEELRRVYAEAELLEGEGVLLPGLVDCHAHLEIAALGGRVEPGLGLAAWVGALTAALPSVPQAERERAALEAAKEMRALGTVAVADVCTNLSTAPILREAGLSGVSLLEVVGAGVEAGRAALRRAEERRREFPAGGGVEVEIIPHSAYGTSEEVLRALAGGRAATPDQAAGELAPYLPVASVATPPHGAWEGPAPGVRSIHAAEHEDELHWLVEGEGAFAPFLRSKGAPSPGKRPIPYLHELGSLGHRTLLVHAVHATEEELALARAAGATLVLCPRSNLHIGGKLPDLPAIRRAGIPWVLGTDSLVSTPDHDLLGEVRVLAEAFPEVPLGEFLQAATTGGAAALGLEHHPWVRIPFDRFPGGREAFA